MIDGLVSVGGMDMSNQSNLIARRPLVVEVWSALGSEKQRQVIQLMVQLALKRLMKEPSTRRKEIQDVHTA